MLNHQTIRNMQQAGLPCAVSEGRYTGRLTLLSNGKQGFDYYGGDGKVRRLVGIPARGVKTRKSYTRVNGPVTIIRPA